MGSETQEWREQNIKVGFTAEHGNAWWAGMDLSGHYPGAVPEDVVRKLLGFPVDKSPVYVEHSGGIHTVPGREAVVAGDNGQVFYIGTDGYKIHHYEQWMVNDVQTMVDGKLPIGSAGLLANRGQAFVQYEMPETITHDKSGEKFRPWLGFATSLDGSMGSKLAIPGVTRWVCENTVSIGLTEGGRTVRHTRNSKHDIQASRDALGIVLGTAEAYVAEIEALTSQAVSQPQWGRFLEIAVPIGKDTTKVGKGKAERKRSFLSDLWTFDNRVAPWSGTAWGVLQAVNTWNTHERPVRAATRDERSLEAFYSGGVDQDDRETLALLERAMI